MGFAESLKRPLWIAPRTPDTKPQQYGTPVAKRWNWRALSSGVDMFAFGPDYKDYRRAVTTNAEITGVSRLDRVWLDRTPSDPTDVLAKDADFYVYSVDLGPGGNAEVVFKRLSPDA